MMLTVNTVSPDSRSLVPEIAGSKVRILWVNDFYDGPLRGVAEIDGHRVLFDLVDRSLLGTDDEDRTYWVIDLTTDQLGQEEYWQDLFCRKVGTHFDFTGRPAPLDEELDLDHFYSAYNLRIPPDYGNNPVVGWFRFSSA